MKSREPGNTCVAAHHSRLVSLFVLSSTLVRPFRESLVGVPWSVRPWVVCPAVTMRGQMSALLRSPVPVAVSGRCPVRASGSACAMSMIFITDTVLCCLCCSARDPRTNWKRRRSRQYQSAHIVNYNTESLAVGVGRSYGAYSVAARCRLTVGANVGRCRTRCPLTVGANVGRWDEVPGGGAPRLLAAHSTQASQSRVSTLHVESSNVKGAYSCRPPHRSQRSSPTPRRPHTEDISVTPLASIEAPDALGSASVKCTSS